MTARNMMLKSMEIKTQTIRSHGLLLLLLSLSADKVDDVCCTILK